MLLCSASLLLALQPRLVPLAPAALARSPQPRLSLDDTLVQALAVSVVGLAFLSDREPPVPASQRRTSQRQRPPPPPPPPPSPPPSQASTADKNSAASATAGGGRRGALVFGTAVAGAMFAAGDLVGEERLAARRRGEELDLLDATAAVAAREPAQVRTAQAAATAALAATTIDAVSGRRAALSLSLIGTFFFLGNEVGMQRQAGAAASKDPTP